jgi:hypothetical protein
LTIGIGPNHGGWTTSSAWRGYNGQCFIQTPFCFVLFWLAMLYFWVVFEKYGKKISLAS